MINYTAQDLLALAVSTLSYAVLVWAPGFALAAAGRFGEPDEPPGTLALLCGLALTPLIDSLVAREAGVGAALAVNLALAAAGSAVAVRRRWRPRLSRRDALLLAAGFVLVAVSTVDFDTGRALYAPALKFDMVKHAATIQAIHDTGAPPADPFFARPGRSGYYYFFYTLGAVAETLCGRWVDARGAYSGLLLWTGAAFIGLVRLCLARTRLSQAPFAHGTTLLVLLVMAVGGLDIVPVLLAGFGLNAWLPDPLLWNSQVGGVVESLLWVPHHLDSLIASILGLMALAREDGRVGWRRCAFAGGCFASALGLSVWVVIGAVATAGVWGLSLLWRRHWRMASWLALAGGVALALAAPQLLDMHAGRAAGPFPIAFTPRSFTPVDLFLGPRRLRGALRLLLLPVNYAVEFGMIAFGAALLLRRRATEALRTEFGRVLALSAACGLAIGGVLRSAILNNDLGARVVLFPLLALLVWTVAELGGRLSAAGGGVGRLLASAPWPYVVLGGLGLATNLYALGANRAYYVLRLNAPTIFIQDDPIAARDLRTAYAFAGAHLPARMVLQQDPTAPRVFDFGLYGRNPTGVADQVAQLYGADPSQVAARVRTLGPIFREDLPAAEVKARARAAGVQALVVDAHDAPWRRAGSWVWTTRPLFAAPRARILPVATLGGAP